MIANRGFIRITRIAGDNLRRYPQGPSTSVLSRARPALCSFSRNVATTPFRKAEPSTEATAEKATEVPLKSSEPSGGFAKAFDKQTGQESFVKMLRNSQLVRLGEPEGKVVEGIIYHIIEDDLYIDFGGKFHCVCVRPLKNGEVYTLGTKVRVMIHDLELSTRFLGAATDLTILEADATLLGITGERRPPGKSVTEELLGS